QAQVMGRRFTQERFATARRSIQKEAFGNRVVKTAKQGGMQKGQLDRVANALNSFLLASNSAPGNWFDASESPIQTFAGANNFDRHPLLAVESHVQADLEFVFQQQR